MFRPYPPALFIFGHQRSGTTLLFRLLRDSMNACPFDEDHAEAFANFRLREPDLIRSIISSSGQPCIFKPISETINFLEIINRYVGSKAVFVFRNPVDVVMSYLLEFAGDLNQVPKNVIYNYIWNKLQDTGITLSSWREIDTIIDRYKGRFSVSTDFVSNVALSWLLLHTTLLLRGVTMHPDVSAICYDDLLESPCKTAKAIGDRLAMDVVFPAEFRIDRERYFYSERIDIQLVRDCMDLYQRLRFPSS